ncbi:MAG: ABC transporter ATP-binding protein [Verrucomicrobia bacterium]|nr:ABC transporter ATP-binding protein [Verrucomicrobiota bacterium]
MKSAVSIRNLTKDFAVGMRGLKLRAVDDVSIEMPAGQVFGLLGPNGCGKSTTLKIALGLVQPTSGTTSILGDGAASPEARRRTGFLPEAPYFHRFLTGRELVRYCARLSGVGEDGLDDAVGRALELTAMSSAADRPVGTYSKGMLQRIGLAQAVVHGPELVILDEPTAGVDPVGAAAIGGMIAEMRSQGRTVVLCSHLLGQVEQVCDRIAIMDRGMVVLQGAVDEVLAGRDRHLIEVSSLTREAESAAREALARAGAVVEGVSRPRRTLEELFRELVTGSKDA